MKKIIIALIIVLLILFVTVYLIINRSEGTSPTNIPGNNNAEIPTPGPGSPTLVPTIPLTIAPEVKEHFEEHHNQQFEDNHPLTKAELIPLEGAIPTEWQLQPAHMFTPDDQGKKFSLNRNVYSTISGRKITIFNTADDTVVAETTSGDDIQQINAAWISDNNLMIVEKDNSDRTLDRMYIFNIQTKQKTFALGSFPVFPRFNLNVMPQIYNNGSIVVFTANDGSLWYMILEFK